MMGSVITRISIIYFYSEDTVTPDGTLIKSENKRDISTNIGQIKK